MCVCVSVCILTLTHNAPHTHCYTCIFIHVADGHPASPHYVTTSRAKACSHTHLLERSRSVTFSAEAIMRSASARLTRIATSAETNGLSRVHTREEEGRMRRASAQHTQCVCVRFRACVRACVRRDSFVPGLRWLACAVGVLDSSHCCRPSELSQLHILRTHMVAMWDKGMTKLIKG